MDTNSSTSQSIYIPPKIQVEPEVLSFGIYNPNLPLIQQPTIELAIHNTGGGTLIGRLVPQVSWLVVNPLNFKLGAGETSQHVIQISTGAPQQLNRDEHQFSNCVVLTSNAGPVGLDVDYTLDFNRQPFQPRRMNLAPQTQKSNPRKLLPGLFVILFLAMALIGMRLVLNQRNAPSEMAFTREELLTQGAQTVFASSGIITDTPEPEAAVIRQATATSQSLFSPLTTDTPDLTATAFQPTFTPWATDQFLNPEVIVTSYFSALSLGDYQSAWNFLSRDYQEVCCTALGTDPYYIFSRDWSAVSDITLVSAFLQEYERNPAPVLVLYQYRNADDELREFTSMFWVVVNEDQTSLIISNIDDLGAN